MHNNKSSFRCIFLFNVLVAKVLFFSVFSTTQSFLFLFFFFVLLGHAICLRINCWDLHVQRKNSLVVYCVACGSSRTSTYTTFDNSISPNKGINTLYNNKEKKENPILCITFYANWIQYEFAICLRTQRIKWEMETMRRLLLLCAQWHTLTCTEMRSAWVGGGEEYPSNARQDALAHSPFTRIRRTFYNKIG